MRYAIFAVAIICSPLSAQEYDTVETPYDLRRGAAELDALNSWAGCAKRNSQLLTNNTIDTARTLAAVAVDSCKVEIATFAGTGGDIPSSRAMLISMMIRDIVTARSGIGALPASPIFPPWLHAEEGAD